MKKLEKTSKLSVNKFQISKIRNPQTVLGGNGINENQGGTVTDTQGY